MVVRKAWYAESSESNGLLAQLGVPDTLGSGGPIVVQPAVSILAGRGCWWWGGSRGQTECGWGKQILTNLWAVFVFSFSVFCLSVRLSC